MKIAHIVYSCIPKQFRGGVPKVVYDLACAQVRLGNEVMIYSTNRNSSVEAHVPIDRIVDYEGVKIQYFSVTDKRWFQSPSLRKCLMQSVEHYDILHSHNTFLALNRYAAEACRRSKVALFYHVHGALDPLVVDKGVLKSIRKRLYIRLFERQNYREANGLFALSLAEAYQIRQYGVKTQTYVIPNGVTLPSSVSEGQVEEFRKNYCIPVDKEVILYLGRIVSKKGLHILIEAFKRLHENRSHTILVIAGNRDQDIAYVHKLDALIRDYNLTNAVIWTGFLDDDAKYAVLKSADIFSHVSASEGMAISILEAMGMGLPTIVSQECYMTEAVREGAILECKYEVGSLYNCLLYLVDNPENKKRLSNRAYQYIRENHSWDYLARNIIDVYTTAIGQAKSVGNIS